MAELEKEAALAKEAERAALLEWEAIKKEAADIAKKAATEKAAIERKAILEKQKAELLTQIPDVDDSTLSVPIWEESSYRVRKTTSEKTETGPPIATEKEIPTETKKVENDILTPETTDKPPLSEQPLTSAKTDKPVTPEILATPEEPPVPAASDKPDDAKRRPGKSEKQAEEVPIIENAKPDEKAKESKDSNGKMSAPTPPRPVWEKQEPDYWENRY